jgi:hypothetical protein
MCEDKDKGGKGELDFSALQRRISQVKVKDGMEEDRQVPFELLPCNPARCSKGTFLRDLPWLLGILRF